MKRQPFTLSAAGAAVLSLLALADPGAAWAGERPHHQAATQRTSPMPAPRTGTLKVAHPAKVPETTILFWDGPIFPPMAQQLEKAIAENKATTKRFLLVLNSPGGSVREGEKVIAELRQLKETHRFDTAVHAGQTCGSMCPFIYAQGQTRLAAPASMWLFHEVAIANPATHRPIRLDRQNWLNLIDKYFVPEGISQAWIEDIKARAQNYDYYASGDSLIRKRSGLITKTMSDARYRNVPSTPQG